MTGTRVLGLPRQQRWLWRRTATCPLHQGGVHEALTGFAIHDVNNT